jgi:hypothetical protein
MTRTKDRRIKQGKDQQILAGIQQDLQGLASIPLGGTIFTPASLEAFFQQRIQSANAVVTAKAAWLDAIQAYLDLDRKAAIIIRDLRNVVIAAFGEDSEKLAHFGFAPTKKPQFTEEQKAAIAKKRTATRKARKTMGKRQKANVTGANTPAPTPPAQPQG